MSEHSFNLLQDNITPPDLWDVIYDWVTNAGRLIVIITEVVVVAAFMVRIVVDTQTRNLKTSLDEQVAYLNSLEQVEKSQVILQKKFTNYKVHWNLSSSYAPLLEQILESAPLSSGELDISVSGETISISGNGRQSQFQEFEETIKTSPNFIGVTAQIEDTGQEDSRGQNLIDYSITFTIADNLINNREKYLNIEIID